MGSPPSSVLGNVEPWALLSPSNSNNLEKSPFFLYTPKPLVYYSAEGRGQRGGKTTLVKAPGSSHAANSPRGHPPRWQSKHPRLFRVRASSQRRCLKARLSSCQEQSLPRCARGMTAAHVPSLPILCLPSEVFLCLLQAQKLVAATEGCKRGCPTARGQS